VILVRQPTDPELTVVNFFSGVGGCALGLLWAGFTGVGAFDLDAKALRGLERNTRWPTFLADVATLSPADVRARVGRCPRLVVMSPPCKRFSDLLPPEQAAAAMYVEMAQLALAGVVLACEAWAPELPPILILENVRGIMGPRGAEILAQIVKLLHRYGYSVDVSTHDCGEYGGLAQHRDRVLIVARQPEVAPDWLRKPPIQRVRNVGEVLGTLPSPLADHGDEMHELPGTSALTALRLACADPDRVVSPNSKGDWRDIPERVRCMWGPVPEHVKPRPRAGRSKKTGKHGAESWGAPAHTVTGAGARPPSSRCSVADPRVRRHLKPARPGSRRAKGSPDDFGVASFRRPHTTVRATMEVQTSRASVADPHAGGRASPASCCPGTAATRSGLSAAATQRAPGTASPPRAACSPAPPRMRSPRSTAPPSGTAPATAT
jgi:site-specific DNA-cytosine methylase